jgi:hypothetical protein
MAAPLVPPDVTLPRLPWVPIHGMRLFDSTFFAVATPAEFRAAFCLWVKSWHQSPPGSLPTNDRELCRLAELGGDLHAWRKVKRMALRHWERCDDGRLYHPVVAELVIESWHQLERRRKRTEAATSASLIARTGSDRRKRNGQRDVNQPDPEPDRTTSPKSPPRNGGDLLAMQGGRGAPAPIDPTILGHAEPCHCDNCIRWAALHAERGTA